MIYIRIKDLLKEKNKSKYWLIKNMKRKLSSNKSFNE